MTDTKIAKRPRTALEALEPYREKLTESLAGRLPEVQFMRVCASLWEGSESLRECNWDTFVLALSEAAEAGLIPSSVLGECYIIPRWNGITRRKEANFQLGYRGAMKLVRRGGDVLDIMPELVYENDEFHEVKGTKREIHHVPWYCLGHDEGGEIRLAYSVAQLRGGSMSYRVIDREAIDKAAAMSGGRNQPMSHVWRDHFGEMALKTAIHRHSKFLPIPDQDKAVILRDMYRADGVEGPDAESTITIEQVSEPPDDSTGKDLEERKAYDAARSKFWGRAQGFMSECGIQLDRTRQDCAEVVRGLVMWLSSEGEPWPDARADQIRHLTVAIGQLDQWADAPGDERRALCDEYSAHSASLAVDQLLGDDAPPEWEILPEEKPDKAATDAAFERAQADRGAELKAAMVAAAAGVKGGE